MSDLPITTTFASTPELAMRSYRACHRRNYLSRLALMLTCLVIGLAEIVIALTGTRSLLWPGVVLALYGVAFYALRERAVRKQFAPFLRGSREVTVTLTDTEYRTQAQGVSTARTWSTFTGVSRVGDFWVLRVSPRAAMGLPVWALDERQTAAFTSLIQAKGLS